MAALWSESGTRWALQDGHALQVGPDLADTLRLAFAGMKSQKVEVEHSEVHPMGPDFAVSMIQGRTSWVDTTGVEHPFAPLALTIVWAREGGGWKMKLSHQSGG